MSSSQAAVEATPPSPAGSTGETPTTTMRPRGSRSSTSASTGTDHRPLPPRRPPSPLHADAEIAVPELLRSGVAMLKVSAKKVHQRIFVLDAERGQISWESKKGTVCNIEAIREMRFGSEASAHRVQFKISAEHEGRWMSIVYLSKGKYKMLHCIALTDDVYAAWKDTLIRVFELRRQLLGGLDHMRKRQTVWLKQHWTEADSTGDSNLDFREILALCRRLNISATEADIRQHFEMADVDGRGYLDFTDFQHFVKLMRRRRDVETVFRQLTFERDELSRSEWLSFMKSSQGSTLDDATLLAIYTKFADDGTASMTIEGFATFLQSTDNSVFSEPQTRVADDMGLPLWDYFISSSHNTYLVGNQLKGESTVEGYIRALQQGARSVELDVWDGDLVEPIIYHGRTLTSKIPVSDALKAIAKYAFVASPYPVVLSLEVHCDQPQQEVLAQLLRTCLGPALVDGRLESDGGGPIQQLPSPEELKYRILVKVRSSADAKGEVDLMMEQAKNRFVDADHSKDAKESSPEESTSESSTSSDSDLKRILTNASSRLSNQLKRLSSASTPGPPLPSPPSLETGRRRAASGSVTPNVPAGPSTVPLAPPVAVATGQRKDRKPPMSAALASLIVYTVGVKARGFSKLAKYAPEHVLSLGERTATKLVKQGQSNDVVSHTRAHLTRSYPSGRRVTSSNYLPHHLWAAGVQMVACNWQTFDLGMEINSAFFAQNGRCGYILKPDVLRTKSKDKEAATRRQKLALDITIISGQQLPKRKEEGRNGDPYVEIGVLAPGSASDGHVKRRTKAVKGNGFNPIFNEPFRIPFEVAGGMLDLCFVRFVVADGQDDEVLGRYCISARVLQPGYRHVPLYDELGQQHLFASLFVRSRVVPT